QYRYLGVCQDSRINHTQLKKEFQEKYKSRVTKLLNTLLSGGNLIKAINSWAVPVLTYSFGIVKWSVTDLDELDRLTRRLLTKFRQLHTNSSVIRLYLPRRRGGRGLLNIKNQCLNQEDSLRRKILNNRDPLITAIAREDAGYTPLSLECELIPVDETEGVLQDDEDVVEDGDHSQQLLVTEQPTAASSSDTPNRPKKRARIADDSNTTIMKCAFEILKGAANNLHKQAPKPTETDAFFAYAATKVNNYSVQVQKLVQHAVFEILMKADSGYYDWPTPNYERPYSCPIQPETVPPHSEHRLESLTVHISMQSAADALPTTSSQSSPRASIVSQFSDYV
ncbi:hypothetical protein NQ318_014735, partial [Aromia moschata]